MKAGLTILALAALLAGAARAETPYERDQREQLEKAQREGTLSPQVQQRLRWEQEWRTQHPGEPMPNAGQMQKLHSAEIQASIRAGGARMWADRQAELRRQHELSRAEQQRRLDAQHIRWTPAQWQQWERDYTAARKKEADDYAKAVALSGEMARQEHEREEQEKLWKQR